MKNFRPSRRATALLCIQLLVSAGAGAQSPLWPEPKPLPVAAP